MEQHLGQDTNNTLVLPPQFMGKYLKSSDRNRYNTQEEAVAIVPDPVECSFSH